MHVSHSSSKFAQDKAAAIMVPSVLQREGQEEARHLGLFFFKEDDAAAMVATVSLSSLAMHFTEYLL